MCELDALLLLHCELNVLLHRHCKFDMLLASLRYAFMVVKKEYILQV